MNLFLTPMPRMLELAEFIRQTKRYLTDFGTLDAYGMWSERGFHTPEASVRFVEWLEEKWTLEEQVGIIMILRQAGISHFIFIRDDLPQVLEWLEKINEPLSHAMGGRIGEVHSGRQSSKYPLEDRT